MRKLSLLLMICLGLLLSGCDTSQSEIELGPDTINNGGLPRERLKETLNGYSVYGYGDLERVICEPMFTFVVLYEYNEVYYITRDLESGSMCYYTYLVYYDEELITLTEGLKLDLFTVEDIREYTSDLYVEERVKIQNENLSQITIHKRIDTVIVDQEDLTSIERSLQDAYFETRSLDLGTLEYTVDLHFEDETVVLLIHEYGIQIKDTNLQHIYSDYVWYSLYYDIEELLN